MENSLRFSFVPKSARERLPFWTEVVLLKPSPSSTGARNFRSEVVRIEEFFPALDVP